MHTLYVTETVCPLQGVTPPDQLVALFFKTWVGTGSGIAIVAIEGWNRVTGFGRTCGYSVVKWDLGN